MCGRQPALLGKKPNKYCYRVECKQAGVTAGHIVPAGARRAGGDAAAVLQPVQMRGDADAQARSAEAEVFEIKETLGIRYAAMPPPRTPMHLTCVPCRASCGCVAL